MKHICISTFLAVALASPAFADLTIKQSTEGKGLGMSGKTAGTTYIKGNKMRTDIVLGDKTQTTIYDVDAQKMYMFDSKKKEADVWDMAAFGQEMTKNVDASTMKASIKPNGQTKPIGASMATGYDMDISMQSALNGNKDMIMTVTLQGPMWIVKGSPGTADYANFYKAAVEKGWIFSDPRAAKAQPGQAKATAEMYRQLAALDGIAYETNMDIKLNGSGPMAGLLARMGSVSMTSTVTSVETAVLADDLFAPPAGYKLSLKK